MTLDQVIAVLTTLQSKMREAGATTDIPLLFYDDNRRDVVHLILDEYDAEWILKNRSHSSSIRSISIPLQLFDIREER